MARIHSNIITQGLSGQIGQQVVFKRYGKKTVVSRYPDMSKVKPSKKQKKEQMKALVMGNMIDQNASADENEEYGSFASSQSGDLDDRLLID